MTVENLTPELARQLGLRREDRGVVVTNVDPSSMAARDGIRPGDLIVAIGTKPIESVADFREATRGDALKNGVRVQVQREGVRRFVYLRSRG